MSYTTALAKNPIRKCKDVLIQGYNKVTTRYDKVTTGTIGI